MLGRLIEAINTRNETSLELVIGSGPTSTESFQWVSMSNGNKNIGPGTGETAYTPETARLLLLQHATAGERWTLGAVTAYAGPSWHGGVDAELHLERQSPSGAVVKTSGKTALSCTASAIYVLSLGDD